MTFTTSFATPTTTSINPTYGKHSWILPDGSLVIAYNAGTDTTYSSGQCILIQSSNWTTASPTWTFVKQITSTTNQRVALWWDATNTRLHCVAGGSTTTGAALQYISATYIGSTWTWDSGITTVVSANTAFPAVCVDSTGAVFVAYRYNSGGAGTFAVYMTAKSGGSWQTPFQISNGSSTSNNYYGALCPSGTNIVCATYEGTQVFATVHVDGTDYFSGWPIALLSSNLRNFTAQGVGDGPLGLYSDAVGSVWISASSTNGTANVGLFVQRLTFSGTTVTWHSTSFTNLDTTGSVSTSVASGVWTSAGVGGMLYLFFRKSLSSNNSDIYYFTLDSVSKTWSSPAINLTNNSSADNQLAGVAFNGITTTIPVIYQSAVTSPFTLHLLTIPIVSSNLANRVRIVTLQDLWHRLRILDTRTRNLPLRLLLAVKNDLALRFQLQDSHKKNLFLRVMVSATHNKNLWLRLILSVQKAHNWPLRLLLSQDSPDNDIAGRLRLLDSNANDLLLRFILRLPNITLKDLKQRMRLSSTIGIRDFATRLVLLVGSTPFPIVPRSVMPGEFATTVVLPIVSPATQLYAINGVVLDSQPSVCTAPAFLSTGIISGNSPFLLTFQAPSANTIALLTNGGSFASTYAIRAFSSTILVTPVSSITSVITMTFACADGTAATGRVKLVVTQSGTTVQVLCTTVVTIVQQKSLILTQFW